MKAMSGVQLLQQFNRFCNRTSRASLQSGLQQRCALRDGLARCARWFSLMAFHVFEREAQAVAGNIMPVFPCVLIAKRPLRHRRLIRAQRSQKRRGRIGHALGRVDLGIAFLEFQALSSFKKESKNIVFLQDLIIQGVQLCIEIFILSKGL